ncbi:MAG: PHP domain-containing protein [Dehalococcoidia bacterium]|nr:PHP domain-containing protein [Dehalococcoidia bacterium]
MTQPRLKADLHVHTCYSKDSTSRPDEIVAHCLSSGINCLAITDHDTIAGALEMERRAPLKIIVGEEILTTRGELIGLFLHEHVPGHLSPEDTVKRIKAQGGLVLVPHPFDRFRPHSRLQRRALDRIASDLDLVEIFNARTMLLQDSNRASRFASSLGLPGTAGSDAHVVREIGRTFMELADFNGAENFKHALTGCRISMARTSPVVHFYNIRNRMLKLVKGHNV